MNHLQEIAWSKNSFLEKDDVLELSSRLGVAQIFLPGRHLFSGDTIGEESSSFSLREAWNDHDFVTRLKDMRKKRCVF